MSRARQKVRVQRLDAVGREQGELSQCHKTVLE